MAIVVGLVARSGLAVVFVGIVAGLPLTYLMHRASAVGLNLLDTDLRYGYSLGLAGALVAVAVLATLIPARRASEVAPVSALEQWGRVPPGAGTRSPPMRTERAVAVRGAVTGRCATKSLRHEIFAQRG